MIVKLCYTLLWLRHGGRIRPREQETKAIVHHLRVNLKDGNLESPQANLEIILAILCKCLEER